MVFAKAFHKPAFAISIARPLEVWRTWGDFFGGVLAAVLRLSRLEGTPGGLIRRIQLSTTSCGRASHSCRQSRQGERSTNCANDQT